MDDSASLQRALETARKVLATLEEQAAAHTFSSIPPSLKLDLDEKRKEVAALEARLESAKTQEQEPEASEPEEEEARESPLRARVDDEYYIERDEVKRFLKRFTEALASPQEQPLLFNICGIGGVGKTTLVGRLKEAHANKVDVLEVCFAKTANVETPLKLMRKVHQQWSEQVGSEIENDRFTQQNQQFEDTLYELTQRSANGEKNTPENEDKIRSWFERLVWLGSANIEAKPKQPGSLDDSRPDFATSLAMGAESENLKEWIQQQVRNHPATKNQLERQALMLEPVTKLTQAFAESLVQVAQTNEKPLVLVLDTYEKAQTYLNQWLWQYLVEDTALSSSSVRLVVVGRRPLQDDEGWRKLNQDRKLLTEIQLNKFDRKQTEAYLKKIGITKGSEHNKIYKITQGLPYYLNWVRKSQESGQSIDFSQGNQAIADLLLQGVDDEQRQLLQVMACCRWFDRDLIRYLIAQEELELQQFSNKANDCFKWLKQSYFVECSAGKYHLDDVARDIFRAIYCQESKSLFRKTNALLADYFKQQADELYHPDTPLPEPYEDKEWRECIADYLYYGLFGKQNEGLHRYIEQFFCAVYLHKPDIFAIPFAAISAEGSTESQKLLPTTTTKFFIRATPTLMFGWIFIDESPGSYRMNFDSETISLEEEEKIIKVIESSIQSVIVYAENIEYGLGDLIGLLYKFIRCEDIKIATGIVMQAQEKLNSLLVNLQPKLKAAISYDIGEFFRHIDLCQESLQCYESAQILGLPEKHLLRSKAEALLGLNKFNQSLYCLHRSIDLGFEKDFLFWKLCGHNLKALCRFEEALDSYRNALDIEPKSSAILAFYGDTLNRMGRHRHALIYHRKAIKADRRVPFFWRLEAESLCSLSMYNEAERSFSKAIEINNKNYFSWESRGFFFLNMRSYEKAFSDAKKSIELEPKAANSLNLLALTHSLRKEFDVSIEYIQNSISIEPYDYLFVANLGIILARAGDYKSAIYYCDQVIQTESWNPGGYYAKACVHAIQGKLETVIDFLEKAIRLNSAASRFSAHGNPDFDVVRDNLRFQELVYPAEFQTLDVTAEEE
ncbi:MAG: hypothetical protein F6J87_22390 [Spirulina sp. SIO3F2]|nr:hypothetical protein [Spirulina sp. SIO3F2]